MHTQIDTQTSAAELAALEARLREVIATVTADPAPPVTLAAVERDMEHLVGLVEASPSVITLAQRYAILAPAAAGIGLQSGSSRVRSAAARIDEAFAVRSIAAPRLTGLLPTAGADTTPAAMAAIAPALARLAEPAATPASSPVAILPAGPVADDGQATVTGQPSASDADLDAATDAATGAVAEEAPFWPFGPDVDEDPAEDPFAAWVAEEVAAGRTITGRAAATYLGVSASTGRRRLDALRATRPELFTPPVIAAVPAPDPTPTPSLATAAGTDVATPTGVAELEEDLEATQIRPRRPAAPSAVIVTSTAGQLTLTGSGVLGRKPAGAGQQVVFPDPDRSVSKTHLAYTVDADGLTVTDLHSGNGTRIFRAGHTIACIPGQGYRVTAGDVVEVGDQHFTLPA